MNKFKKPQFQPHSNPINFYNNILDVKDFVADLPTCRLLNDKSATITDKNGCTYTPNPDFNGYYTIDGVPHFEAINDGQIYSRFELLQVIKFAGNFDHALTYVQHKHMNDYLEWPYIIVGKDIYKKIPKKNAFGIVCTELKQFNSQIIIKRHGKLGDTLTSRNAYDDFTIYPDNINYKPVVDNFYNLYHPFPHVPHTGKVTADDISHTLRFLDHVFGDQIELGKQYLKIMYEYPCQQLPLLVLVSKERQTGKTSFLNFLSMLFGANYVQVSPDDLVSDFNVIYATKNVIGVDETVIDRKNAIERIKSLVTSSTILVNQKGITQYQIPFYGKLIMTSNRETDFMRIDTEEIRFWVRKLTPFGRVDKDFFDKLKLEIPFFLKYLNELPKREYKSRMVFSAEELINKELHTVMTESKSSLYKELYEYITDHFDRNQYINDFSVSLKDIKERWFERDTRISGNYIKKILIEEFHLEQPQKLSYYRPFGQDAEQRGRVYTFKRDDYDLKQIDNNELISANNNPIQLNQNEAPF
jgi:hypothetical protein